MPCEAGIIPDCKNRKSSDPENLPVAKVPGFSMDGTNSKIVLECASNISSLAIFKRIDINVDYNKDEREISISKDPGGVQVILKDKL